ncbi:MAG: Holliday junction branch migration protein RuvA [Proteobacteria bacterium]|nr:Holliday junction branch migration protein RuvA [Pseudomonadota bacterium]
MIGQIRGILLEVVEGTLVVDVQGVGYELEPSATLIARLPAAGGEIRVHTHFVVREDVQLLFAFDNRAERDLFRAMIRISGIGPKLALALIAGLSLKDLARAVAERNITVLTSISGVGRKTAERLVVELKDLLAGIPTIAEPTRSRPSHSNEALDALVALGYKPAEAARIVENVADEAFTTEEIVRAALKRIARQSEAL